MDIKISPCKLRGVICAVASKSYAHRAIIAAALSNKKTEIIMNTTSEDIKATLSCIKALGGDYETTKTGVLITPIGVSENGAELNCGESGSTARFLIPVAAALTEKTYFKGSGRLPERPQKDLVEAIKHGGGDADSDKLPMTVYGKLKRGKYEIKGNVSSQYITGLMFALGKIPGESEIHLTTPLESAPYVDITAEVLGDFGIKIIKEENSYRVFGGEYKSPGIYKVEGDWSNSAFWLIASRMGSEVQVTGLKPNSLQGDKAVMDVAGEDIIDALHIPDLVPILAVYGASKKGVTKIINAGRLKIKESDRLKTVCENLKALGGDITCTDDGLIINGKGYLSGGKADGCGDHRIVMAMSIAATICKEPVVISGAEAVSKSYPQFFEDFKMLGGNADVV